MKLLEIFNKFFSKRVGNFRFVFFALLVVVSLAYGLTLEMYFWKDDFALMIKAMHPQESVGFFGEGFWGDGPYKYIAVPFALMYPIFKLNALPYFLVGFFLYFFATIAVYFLGLKIFEKKDKAFFTALIFGSGYVGADSIFGLTNSYQTSWTIILLCLVIIFLIKHFREGSYRAYFISLLLFYINLDGGFIRAHGFFLIIVATFFLVIRDFKIKQLSLFLTKMLPFLLIFARFYLFSKTATNGSNHLIENLLKGDLSIFKNPIITFVNVFIPTPINRYAYLIVNNFMERQMNIEKVFMVFSGIFVGVNLILVIRFIKNKIFLPDLRVLIFSLCAAMGSFIGVYFIGAAATYFESTHRYLSSALIGVSLYWVALFSLLFGEKTKFKRFFYLAPILVSVVFLVYSNVYALETINSRTKLQKDFFNQLKAYIPEIHDKTFMYFDVSNLKDSAGRFGGIFGAGSVGGSPEISLQYDVDRYSIITAYGSFEDFLGRYKKENGQINRTYAFYYDDGKLKNNTDLFRKLLVEGATTNFNLEELGLGNSETAFFETKYGKNREIMSPEVLINFPTKAVSLTPGILKFKLKIDPAESNFDKEALTSQNDYLEYLISRKDFYNQASVTALNYFQNNLPANLLDQKNDTYWMADRGVWNGIINKEDSRAEFLEITLKNPMNVGGILFTNGHTLRTPTRMKILNFENGNWKEIKTVSIYPNKISNEKWFEEITPVFTNKIRIEVLNSISGDAPQLAEVELVDQKYAKLNFSFADEIEFDPSKLLQTNASFDLIKNYFSTNGKFSYSFYSDKDGSFINSPVTVKVKGLGEDYEYEVPLPANGNYWTQGKFTNLNLPAKYTFSNFQLTNLPLSVLTQ